MALDICLIDEWENVSWDIQWTNKRLDCQMGINNYTNQTKHVLKLSNFLMQHMQET